MKNWKELSDEELKQHIRSICLTSTSEDDVNERAKEELGYPYKISVTFETRDMFMAMFWSRDGLVLRL